MSRVKSCDLITDEFRASCIMAISQAKAEKKKKRRAYQREYYKKYYQEHKKECDTRSVEWRKKHSLAESVAE